MMLFHADVPPGQHDPGVNNTQQSQCRCRCRGRIPDAFNCPVTLTPRTGANVCTENNAVQHCSRTVTKL